MVCIVKKRGGESSFVFDKFLGSTIAGHIDELVQNRLGLTHKGMCKSEDFCLVFFFFFFFLYSFIVSKRWGTQDFSIVFSMFVFFDF